MAAEALKQRGVVLPTTVPSKKVSLMSEWETKMKAIVSEVLTADVGSLSGVPSWMMVLLQKVGPQHAFLRDAGRVEYVTASDDETIAAFQLLCRTEGIIPALESAHALAHAIRLAPTMNPDKVVVVNLSGRGDKDVDYVAEYLAR